MAKEQNGTGTELSSEQVREVVNEKTKRGAHWVQELTAEGSTSQPGDNSRFVRHALASWNLPPIDISDAKQVADRIELYFHYCVENDRRPQVVGMCNWLGINRQTLNEWKNGVTRRETHGDIIKRAYGVIEEMWTDFMLYGKVNPPAGIFLAKNWFNYSDAQEIVVTPNDPLQGMDTETARKRLIDAIPAEDDE